MHDFRAIHAANRACADKFNRAWAREVLADMGAPNHKFTGVDGTLAELGILVRNAELVAAANLGSVLKIVDELVDRVAAIESKGVEYKGVWQPSQDYKRGDLVTRQGAIWHANHDTRDVPGSGITWTLAVKAGAK